MNENQHCNDHHLHIEPCLCGNPSPEVGGDDFDADVMCDVCRRITPGDYYGTRQAIPAWNKLIADHKAGIALFRRPIPESATTLENAIRMLSEAAKDCQEAKEQKLADALLKSARELQETHDQFCKENESKP